MSDYISLPELPVARPASIEIIRDEVIKRCDVGINLGRLACFVADLSEGISPPELVYACGQAAVVAGYKKLRNGSGSEELVA